MWTKLLAKLETVFVMSEKYSAYTFEYQTRRYSSITHHRVIIIMYYDSV